MTTTEQRPVKALPFDIDQAIEEVWIRAEAAHARSWQPDPGPSDAGTCQRRVGFMFHKTPPSDPPELSSPAATLGTWIHERWLPLLQDVLGGEIEFETLTDGVRGHGDWYGRPAVLDLKTKAEASLSRLRLHGASARQLWQAHLYAADRIAARHPVDFVIVVFLARDTGNHYAAVYEYDPELTQEALDWFRIAREAAVPDVLPRGGRGPKLDRMCDGCRWLTRCWPNDQMTILDEAPDRDVAVIEAINMYEDAAVREKDARRDKEFAASIFAGEPAGPYGDFELRHQSSGWRLDQKQAEAMLIELGEVPPKNAPTYSPRVTRKKAPAAKGARRA